MPLQSPPWSWRTKPNATSSDEGVGDRLCEAAWQPSMATCVCREAGYEPVIPCLAVLPTNACNRRSDTAVPVAWGRRRVHAGGVRRPFRPRPSRMPSSPPRSNVANVLVVGTGAAGLRAAIAAHQAGSEVVVVGKRRREDAHTVLAAGGINAALGTVDPQDSWQQHFGDTLREGYFLADPRVVELMATEAPAAVLELADWGARYSASRDVALRARGVVGAADQELSGFIRHGRQFARPLQRALRDTMWESCGVLRDQAGLQHGLERLAELGRLAAEVDVRPTSEGYGDLAHALDLRASLATAEATLVGALARTESRGAHQRRDHPELDPELRVNFQTRLDGTGRLTVDARPVPPIPPRLQAWAEGAEDLSVGSRLLE
jgi:succinate dehydrogenase/fumarate reductase flavoprotein subunit